VSGAVYGRKGSIDRLSKLFNTTLLTQNRILREDDWAFERID
jgi:hypothetical protein